MSIANKLKFKEGTIVIVNMPASCASLFEELKVSEKLSDVQQSNQTLLFASEQKMLNKSLNAIVKKLSHDCIFWIAYPQKSGSIKSDLSRDSFWNILDADGYIPVMQVALDKDWSALRFRKKNVVGKMIRNTPMKEREIEGVDFVNRKVQLPIDATKAIRKVKGLEGFFYALSFSHQKEYVTSIVEAKKEETRKRRIDKMVEMVVALRANKEAKK